MAELHLLWQNSTNISLDKKEIEQHLLEVLLRLKAVGRVEVEISLVTDKEIKALKQRFFGINEPTDVLSFAYDRPEFASRAGAAHLKPSKRILGDEHDQIEGLTGSIAISINTATKQASSAGIKLLDEVKMLASHGLLHLLGFNHR